MPAKPVDLEAMSAAELTSLIQAAQTMRDRKLADAKTALLAEFRSRSAELGVSIDELYAPAKAPVGRKVRKDAGITPAQKYRSPDGATWSGRGRKPGWLHAAEADGKTAEDFLI